MIKELYTILDLNFIPPTQNLSDSNRKISSALQYSWRCQASDGLFDSSLGYDK